MSPEDTPPRMQTYEAVEASRGGYRRLLSNRGFRRLWFSQFVSGVGDWLVIGLLMPLVTSLSGGSSFAVAGIMIAKIIPALLFSSVIGVFVDRFDRRRTMIACDLARALLALGLLFTNDLAIIYLIVLLMETASLFFFPAKNALIPYLVEEEDVTAANGLSYTTQQASMLIGLLASGAIVAAFEAIVRWVLAAGLPLVSSLVGLFEPALLGPRAGVFLDTLTFLLSALSIWGIHLVAKPADRGARMDLTLIGRDVVESFRFLGEHRELRGFLVTVGAAILGGGTIIPVGIVHVNVGRSPIFERIEFLQRLAATPQTFLLVFLAFGMVFGALIVPRISERLSLQLLFLGGVGGFGLSMFGLASVTTYSLAAIFAVTAGVCLAIVTVAGNTYVIHTVADEIRGRVFTAMESVIRVSLLLSMLVMAPVADLAGRIVKAIVESRGMAASSVTITGSQVALQLASLVVLAAAVYAYRTLNWRRCEEVAEESV